MKKTFILFAVFLGLVSARFSPSLISAATPEIQIKITPPAAALDTTDLDARDEFNRPVRSAVAKQSFEQLWMKNLSEMLLAGLTPARVRLCAFLKTCWKNGIEFFVDFFERARSATLALSPMVNAFVRPMFSGLPCLLPSSSSPHNFDRANFRSDLMVVALASIQILR